MKRTARGHGRPTVAMATFVRLMVIEQRTVCGYKTLVREVSDSLDLRRFRLISLTERVPDESTLRKLARRLGPEVVDEITRAAVTKATRERRLVARAARIDSTVVSAAERLEGELDVERRGSEAYEHNRATARDRLGRRVAGGRSRIDRPTCPPGR